MIRDVVAANVKRLIDTFDDGVPTRTAKRLKLHQRSVDRYYKGEQTPSVEQLELLAQGNGLEAWHMLIPDLDVKNPPVITGMTQAERDLYASIKKTIAELGKI